MTGNYARYRWVAALAVLVLVIAAGGAGYNAGYWNGLAQAAQSAAAQGGAPPPYPYAYGWHRPWGFGFGFPLLFFAFWFFLMRGLWGGGPWRRRWYLDDEWHRRAHERMKENAPADDSGRGR